MQGLQSAALQELRENAQSPCGPALREWKENGGLVMGLLYGYFPEEIFVSAGMIPYRWRAQHGESTAFANARFQDISCTLVRRFYDEAKRGGFEFCDGLVSVNACDHLRRLYENIVATIDIPFAAFANFPKKTGPEQVDFYASGLRKMIAQVEEHFGMRIGETELRKAIDDYNRIRALQRRLYELRRSETPPMTGTDMLAVMLAQSAMPLSHYTELLTRVVADAENAPGISDYIMRAFIYGGELDSFELMEAIESQGALVVGDWMGFGMRNCREDVPNTGDAVHDLAEWMVMLRPDPRQWGTQNLRQPLVEQLMAECGAEGVIFPAITFCDHWTWEQFNFQIYAKEHGIPLLNLETEYNFIGEGQTKTRVQAFAEANGRG